MAELNEKVQVINAVFDGFIKLIPAMKDLILAIGIFYAAWNSGKVGEVTAKIDTVKQAVDSHDATLNKISNDTAAAKKSSSSTNEMTSEWWKERNQSVKSLDTTPPISP